jgi:hypothetical protein
MSGSRRYRSMTLIAVLAAAAPGCGGGDPTDPNPDPPATHDPSLVTTTGFEPAHLTLSNGTLFWSQHDATPIRSIPVAGGSPVTVAHKIGVPSGITFRDQEMFWLDDQPGNSPVGCVGDGVVRVLRKGRTTQLAIGDQCYQSTSDLAVTATDVYWVSSVGTEGEVIRRTPVNGGTTSAFVTPASPVVAMLSDGAYLYWLEDVFPDHSNAIRRIPFSGGPVETVVSGFMSEARTFAINSGTLFYFVYDSPDSETLYSVSLSGGASSLVGATGIKPLKLAADESALYWIDVYGTTVSAMPVTGGNPTVLATPQHEVFDLMVRANDVLWSESDGNALPQSGTVNSVPKSGGSVAVLAQGEDAPGRLVADGSWIYWTEGASLGLSEGFGRIGRAPAAGGPAETVVSGVAADSPPISVNDNYVFIADKARIKRVPRAGGTVETLAKTLYRISDLVADQSYVYWLEDQPFSTIKRAPVGGGAVTQLASSLLYNGAGGIIRLQGGALYWTAGPFNILSVPASGGPLRVVASGLPYISDMMTDATHVYWSENDTGLFKRMPIGGGAPVTFSAAGLGMSYNILAVDDTHLYWIDQLKVGKVRKSDSEVSPLTYDIRNLAFLRPGIVVDDGFVYWTDPALQMIRRLEK